MRAVLLYRPGAAEVTVLPDPAPGPGDVIVEVTGAGLCGTDVHIFDGLFPPTPYPIVPGHEFAGRVAAVGTEVVGVLEGELVAADCTLTCGRCHACRSGRYNLCSSWGAIGDTIDGAFARYVRVPAVNVFRWPAEVAHGLAPLTEPLACTVHGMDRLGPVLGARTLVVGAGVMGALAGQLLRLGGGRVVDVCERAQQRRDLAAAWADRTFADVEEVEDRYDVVIDATGVPTAIEGAIDAAAPGGRFLLLGVAPQNAVARISPYELFKRELTLLGSMSKRYSFQPALDLIAGGSLDLAPLVEPSLPLASYGEAIDAVRSGRGMKAVLDPAR